MRIDSWERLEFVLDLIRESLPINVRLDLTHLEIENPMVLPLPYDPSMGSSTTIPTPSSCIAEVRVSLCMNETLAWLLPVQFCIDQLLTAEEVITKLADAFWFLEGWSRVHAHEGHKHLQTQRLQPHPRVKSPGKYLIQ